jgi:hypothetical protein
VLRRPLPAVLGLTVADYLLWSWSAADGPRVLALVCGLALTLLLLVLAWMLIASLMRFLVDRSPLSRRVEVGRGAAPASTRGVRAPAVARAVGRRGTATVRRIRRGATRRTPHRADVAAREAVETGHARHAERIAA